MPTNRTGNPAAQQSPSPAPAPGALPIQSIPLGSEAPTIESITEALTVNSDYTAYLQTSIKQDTPVTPTSSGYSSVTHTGGGGGTVAPSGAGASFGINTGTRFVVKIILGGATGTATFQMSTDGGNTYGGTQTTAASMTDATSGIHLAFSGTFVATDTYAWRSGFTPRAQWVDAGGSVKHVIDHNGYPLGRRYEFRETWPYTTGGGISTTQVVFGSRYNYAVVGTSPTLTCALPGTLDSNLASPLMQISVAGTNGDQGTITTGGQIAPNPSKQPFVVMTLEFEAIINTVSATNKRYFMGLTSGQPFSTGVQGIWFTMVTGADWLCETRDSVTVNSVDSGVAAVNNTYQRFKIECYGASSYYGALAVNFFINDALVVSSTTHIPDTASALFWGAQIGNFAASSGTAILNIGEVLLTYNRVASLPAL